MSVIGLITAYQCEHEIGAAVRSLRDGGCHRVVVLDGAWPLPDGTPFGGGDWFSTDRTWEEARRAGATFLQEEMPIGGDGAKRQRLLEICGAGNGDHLLFLDSDEILVGKLDPATWPYGHGCVIHRDLHANDLSVGGVWPHGDYGPEKPLLRWMRWSDDLRCERPGVFHDAAGRIHAYLVGAMAERAAGRHDPLFAHAYRALRDVEEHIPLEVASLLPIVPGVEIHHASEPSPDRVAAKERYHSMEPAAA